MRPEDGLAYHSILSGVYNIDMGVNWINEQEGLYLYSYRQLYELADRYLVFCGFAI